MSSSLRDIPDSVFDRTHDYFDSNGDKILSSLRPSTAVEEASSDAKKDATGGHPGEWMQSVYMATGIHHQITEDILEDLPRRFEAGNVKSRFTWFGALCLAGIGMFVEAYIIITTGQIKTVWSSQYPTCFSPHKAQVCPDSILCCGLFPNTPTNENGTCAVNTTLSGMCTPEGFYDDSVLCNPAILGAQSYTSFAGIMMGMLVFGALADMIGRNSAGIVTSSLMIVGVMVMTFVRADDLNAIFLIWAIFFGVFGLGVGGEYPLSASGAAEYHSQVVEESKLEDDERRHLRILREHEKTARRGETIGIVFSMQGIGAVVGSVYLLVLLYFAGDYFVECEKPYRQGANSAGVDAMALDGVWRSFYFIGSIFVTMVLLYRYLVVDEGEGHAKLQKRKERRATQISYLEIFQLYGLRLIGTGGNWFVWDVCFYGLKLFSGPIFADLAPSGDLLIQNGYLLVNNLIALVAYYVAAYIIDIPSIGRKKVQAVFFIIVSVIFLIMTSIFDNAGSTLLMILYFMTSFFGQFVNTTTYVMAAETYPAELRGTLHGMSAFLGKWGALMATILFGSLSTQNIFLVCGIVGLIGAFLTILFSADLTHVSLSEHDAKLELYLEGRADDYKGKLNDPKHLSLFERLTGWHGEYDPEWAKKLIQSHKLSEEEKIAPTQDAQQ